MSRVWTRCAVAALALAHSPAGLAQDQRAQDQRDDVVVSELVIHAPEEALAPLVGAGTPQFTAQEIATIQDEALRREVLTGRPSARVVIDTELARQAAVNALVAARNELADASAANPEMQRLVSRLDSPLPTERGWERNSVDKIMPQVLTFNAIRASELFGPDRRRKLGGAYVGLDRRQGRGAHIV